MAASKPRRFSKFLILVFFSSYRFLTMFYNILAFNFCIKFYTKPFLIRNNINNSNFDNEKKKQDTEGEKKEEKSKKEDEEEEMKLKGRKRRREGGGGRE